MLEKAQVQALQAAGRSLEIATAGDPDLGPLQLLPGTWSNLPNLPGRGWNMIALPSINQPPDNLNYRLLMNQYNEELKFSLVDKAVANRGIDESVAPAINTDQFVVALDYEQMIKQIAADDNPPSGLAGPANLPIHHEPGLWLHMTNETSDGLDIARLSTIPHGDSVLALGTAIVTDGPPTIPVISGLPIGVNQSLSNPYLAPYAHYNANPFRNLFEPVDPNDLLRKANQGVNILRTTELTVSTKVSTAGIKNIPFVVRQADAAEMVSTFWIQELDEVDLNGNQKLRLQYSQTVFLDFFDRKDGEPGLIRWPHVSINTLEKVADASEQKAFMPADI